MSRKRLSDPQVTIDRFVQKLAKAAFDAGWLVARTVGDGSERSFAIVRQSEDDRVEIKFFAKLSQSERGWWGVMFARALGSGPRVSH